MALSPAVMPSQSRVTIIGGGIAGVSIAYHLGKLGIGCVHRPADIDRNLLESGRFALCYDPQRTRVLA